MRKHVERSARVHERRAVAEGLVAGNGDGLLGAFAFDDKESVPEAEA